MNSFKKSAVGRASFVTALALSQLLWLAPAAVQAADDSVRLAGQVLFTANGAGDMSADQRAEAIQRNLDNALVAAQDRSPGAVNIVYVKGVPVITLGGYQVVTINASDAKEAGTTPAILAQRWADALRGSLQDQGSVTSYVNQLNGGYQSSAPPSAANGPANATQYNPPPQGGPGGPGGQYQGGANQDQFGRMTGPPPGYQGNAAAGGYPGGPGGPGGPGYPMQTGHVVYAPAGLTMPASLRTSISTQAAQAGDMIEAGITDVVNLDGGSLPPGTVLVGQIVAAKAGGFLGRSGMLEVKFNRLRTPDGQETPIAAHIVGGIGKYALKNGDTVEGETWKNKVGQAALRGVVGAGAGAALGTAVGAIAGAGNRRPWFAGGGTYAGQDAGRGAWSGAAIGGGVGVADSLLLRKGKDVTIKSGTNMQIQLDSPATIGAAPPSPYGGPPYGNGAVGGQPPYGQGY